MWLATILVPAAWKAANATPAMPPNSDYSTLLTNTVFASKATTMIYQASSANPATSAANPAQTPRSASPATPQATDSSLLQSAPAWRDTMTITPTRLAPHATTPVRHVSRARNVCRVRLLRIRGRSILIICASAWVDSMMMGLTIRNA